MDLIVGERIHVKRENLRLKQLPHSENRTWRLVIGKNKYNFMDLIVGERIHVKRENLRLKKLPHSENRTWRLVIGKNQYNFIGDSSIVYLQRINDVRRHFR